MLTSTHTPQDQNKIKSLLEKQHAEAATVQPTGIWSVPAEKSKLLSPFRKFLGRKVSALKLGHSSDHSKQRPHRHPLARTGSKVLRKQG
jgi:hypothetical protein